MKRREILKYTALTTGTVISAPLLNAILSGCTTNQSGEMGFQPSFFSPEDFQLVTALVDIILPASDTPSASDLKVDTTIDNIVGKVYDKDEQADYSMYFNALKKKLFSLNFMEISIQEKAEILKDILSSDDSDEKKGFINLKQQTVAFYLLTEEIAKNHLNYLPVPGEYEGCITLEEVGGKKWAI